MTPEEKKERINYLWDRLRTHVKAQAFLLKTQATMHGKFLDHFANQSAYDEEDIVKMGQEKVVEKDPIPWYLFHEESIGIIIWEILMGLPLLYVCTVIPIMQVIETLQYPYEVTSSHLILHEVCEALFMIDLLFSFFKVP